MDSYYIAVILIKERKKSKFQLVKAKDEADAEQKVYEHHYRKGVLLDEIEVSIKPTLF